MCQKVSIGFTVNAKTPDSTETTATINVIVATDPSQGVEQLITVSRFGSGPQLLVTAIIKRLCITATARFNNYWH